MLIVRFRRGDNWQLGYARTLSSSSISISTGCPPREADRVDIEVRFEDLTVITPAHVLAVTPAETARLLGAYGFGARFAPPDADTATALRRIHTLVSRDDTLVGRPPRRAHARYPVRWPIAVGVRGLSTRLAALDISEGGMFVQCDDFVRRGTPTGITVPLDVEGEPVRAGAMVTRTLRGQAALSREIPTGFGVELLSMSPGDAGRYDGLVRRIATRSGRRILVGADDRRLAELTAALHAVGYTAAGTSDVQALLAAAATSPAPDLVIVDESLAGVRDRPTFLSFSGVPTAIYRLADAALA